MNTDDLINLSTTDLINVYTKVNEFLKQLDQDISSSQEVIDAENN